MKLLLALFLFLALGQECSAAPDNVVLIGHFSNMQATEDDDPHIVAGYSVHLYRHGKTLFGNLAVATGSLEPAQGRLFDIEFDPSTKKLRFKAKYVTGWQGSKKTGPAGREARELLTFAGKLTNKTLAGRIVVKDGYALNEAGTKIFASMKRTDDDDRPGSFNEWAGYKHLDGGW
jgi:hypothetical protein